MTTIAPKQRTAIGRHRRGLEVILADAPAGAAVIVAAAVPPVACGPPVHVHAASDETFLILSGVLLVHASEGPGRQRQRGTVEWARGAVPGLLPARFPGPLAAPAVRLSTQRALHGYCRQAGSAVQGPGILVPR